MARKIEVEIVGDASRYQRALGQAQSKTSKFGMVAKAALIGGAAAGFVALTKAAKIGWDEFNAGQKVAAQTNAVIKSTGGVANVTAKEVENLGEALMRKSGVDDEVIKSGENMLLTFTKIRNEAGKNNDIFTQATKLTLDLSVAMGRDMTDSAIMVGKALNDPERGLTALRRVGVAFNDQQQETVKRLVATGQTMKAQKLILHELRVEFGGSAAAAGKTFGGQLNILRERLNNFLGVLVGRAIPYLQRFIKWVGPILSRAFAQAQAVTNQYRNSINQLGAVLQRHQASVQVFVKAVQGFIRVVQVATTVQRFWLRVVISVWSASANAVLAGTDKIIGALRRVVGPIQTLISWLRAAYNWLSSVFNRVWTLRVSVPSLPGGPGLIDRLRQHGGPVSAGQAYVVGEKRPELFVPNTSGRILPRVPAMAGGRGGGSVVPSGTYMILADSQVVSFLERVYGRHSKRNGY